MLKAVASVNGIKPVGRLPAEMPIALTEPVMAACPTHMLAVYSRRHAAPQPDGTPTPYPVSGPVTRKVTLFPVHSLVFAAYCTNLPPLCDPRDVSEAPDGFINLPIIPLGLPSAETFALLQAYLYTKRIDMLLAALMPAVPTGIPPGTHIHDEIKIHGKALGEAFELEELLKYAAVINGLWRSSCVLGVHGDPFWKAINLAWGSVAIGLDIAKKRYVPPPHIIP